MADKIGSKEKVFETESKQEDQSTYYSFPLHSKVAKFALFAHTQLLHQIKYELVSTVERKDYSNEDSEDEQNNQNQNEEEEKRGQKSKQKKVGLPVVKAKAKTQGKGSKQQVVEIEDDDENESESMKDANNKKKHANIGMEIGTKLLSCENGVIRELAFSSLRNILFFFTQLDRNAKDNEKQIDIRYSVEQYGKQKQFIEDDVKLLLNKQQKINFAIIQLASQLEEKEDEERKNEGKRKKKTNKNQDGKDKQKKKNDEEDEDDEEEEDELLNRNVGQKRIRKEDSDDEVEEIIIQKGKSDSKGIEGEEQMIENQIEQQMLIETQMSQVYRDEKLEKKKEREIEKEKKQKLQKNKQIDEINKYSPNESKSSATSSKQSPNSFIDIDPFLSEGEIFLTKPDLEEKYIPITFGMNSSYQQLLMKEKKEMKDVDDDGGSTFGTVKNTNVKQPDIDSNNKLNQLTTGKTSKQDKSKNSNQTPQQIAQIVIKKLIDHPRFIFLVALRNRIRKRIHTLLRIINLSLHCIVEERAYIYLFTPCLAGMGASLSVEATQLVKRAKEFMYKSAQVKMQEVNKANEIKEKRNSNEVLMEAQRKLFNKEKENKDKFKEVENVKKKGRRRKEANDEDEDEDIEEDKDHNKMEQNTPSSSTQPPQTISSLSFAEQNPQFNIDVIIIKQLTMRMLPTPIPTPHLLQYIMPQQQQRSPSNNLESVSTTAEVLHTPYSERKNEDMNEIQNEKEKQNQGSGEVALSPTTELTKTIISSSSTPSNPLLIPPPPRSLIQLNKTPLNQDVFITLEYALQISKQLALLHPPPFNLHPQIMLLCEAIISWAVKDIPRRGVSFSLLIPFVQRLQKQETILLMRFLFNHVRKFTTFMERGNMEAYNHLHRFWTSLKKDDKDRDKVKKQKEKDIENQKEKDDIPQPLSKKEDTTDKPPIVSKAKPKAKSKAKTSSRKPKQAQKKQDQKLESKKDLINVQKKKRKRNEDEDEDESEDLNQEDQQEDQDSDIQEIGRQKWRQEKKNEKTNKKEMQKTEIFDEDDIVNIADTDDEDEKARKDLEDYNFVQNKVEEVEEEEDDDADEDYVSDKLESGEFQDSISPDYQRRAQRIVPKDVTAFNCEAFLVLIINSDGDSQEAIVDYVNTEDDDQLLYEDSEGISDYERDFEMCDGIQDKDQTGGDEIGNRFADGERNGDGPSQEDGDQDNELNEDQDEVLDDDDQV
ncbi:MAG: hypothetical protein EZS28_008118 [Streblomastix strix]|uniref:Uncharacterized protein n=1 Tax=Streblomastix strix TaxID=222440 RepID=A0A5J4WP42_9EUKA|nr:MAG: hypothetical protein EZS28_008118 [Streblomastix strix]